MRTEPVDMIRVYATAFGVDPDKLVNAVNKAEAPDTLTLQAADLYKVDPLDVTPEMRRGAKAIFFHRNYGTDPLDSLTLSEIADRLETDR